MVLNILFSALFDLFTAFLLLVLTGKWFKTVISSDKTGTLTRNEMVLKMWVRDGHVCSVEEVALMEEDDHNHRNNYICFNQMYEDAKLIA